VLSEDHFDLRRRGAGHTATVQITAAGGPVSWTATLEGAAVDWLAVSPSSGQLDDAEVAVVTIRVTDSNAPAGDLQVRFGPGDLVVTVTLA
jgi:hypothetical protein